MSHLDDHKNQPQDAASWAAKNRQYFDSMVDRYYTEEWIAKLVKYTSEQVVAHLDWIGVDWVKSEEAATTTAVRSNGNDSHKKSVRVLDYACGPGTISAILAPYATCIRGIDVSPNMISKYNARFSSSDQDLKTDAKNVPDISAVVGDILTEESSHQIPGVDDPIYGASTFDLALTSFALHHFHSPKLALHRLTHRVKPRTGIVLTIDFLPFTNFSHSHSQNQHPHPNSDTPDAVGEKKEREEREEEEQKGKGLRGKDTIQFHGFSEPDMRQLYADAGLLLTDFRFDVLPDPVVIRDEDGNESLQRVFFARGVRSG